MIYPTFPGVLEAPITATDSGLNILVRSFISFSPVVFYIIMLNYNDK